MTVSIIRHGGHSCEPECPAWIAASGVITNDTPAEFRKVFAKLGREKLPVIINSPGGRLFAALKIGRMIRARGLSVAVGETQFDPLSDGIVISSEGGSCKSACPFILAAGVERYSGEGRLVGLHQPLLVKNSRARSVNMLASPSQLASQSASNARLFRAMRSQVRSYLAEMGVSQLLANEMERASAGGMNYLSLERQKQLRLITSEMTAVQLVPQPMRREAAAAIFVP